MSPEQARGEIDHLGPATDIYSLGATLYYVVTGKSPFMEEDIPAVLRKVERGEFLSPRKQVPAWTGRSTRSAAKRLRCALKIGTPRREHWPTISKFGSQTNQFQLTTMTLMTDFGAYRWLRRRKKLAATASALLIFAFFGLVMHDWSISQEKARTSDQLAMTRKSLRTPT